MAEASRGGALRLLCGSDQQPGALGLPAACHRSLAALASPTQPARWHDMGSHSEAGRRLAPQTAGPTSLAERAVCRHSPEVGAGCLNWARPDLCGGHPATGVPTAIKLGRHGAWIRLGGPCSGSGLGGRARPGRRECRVCRRDSPKRRCRACGRFWRGRGTCRGSRVRLRFWCRR